MRGSTTASRTPMAITPPWCRLVTLRAGPDVPGPAGSSSPLGESLDAMLAAYPPELLERIEGFLDDLAGTMDGPLARPAPPPRPARGDF